MALCFTGRILTTRFPFLHMFATQHPLNHLNDTASPEVDMTTLMSPMLMASPRGDSPYTWYPRMCHLTGMVWRKIALQKGPSLLKIEVLPLKNACFANIKRKICRKSSESYIFRHFLLTLSKICLKTESKFRRWRALSKGGVRDPQVAHPHTKIGEEPPPPPPPGGFSNED